jgi:hypothetical protein
MLAQPTNQARSAGTSSNLRIEEPELEAGGLNHETGGLN